MTEDDLVSQLVMALQLNAMKEVDPFEDNFVSDAKVVVEFLKKHFEDLKEKTHD